MDVYLSGQEIIYAALIAAVFTVVLEFLLHRYSPTFAYSSVFEYDSNNVECVKRTCYTLFPKDMVKFRGNMYERGAYLLITTSLGKFEGSLIGQNYDNMICLITPTHIIAQDLGSIKDIRTL